VSGPTSQIAPLRCRSIQGRLSDEADLSAESDSAEAKSRLSRENALARWPGNLEAPPGEGPEAPRSRGLLEVAMTSRTGRFRRADRILGSSDFQRVGRCGRRLATADFVVLVDARADERPACRRLGVTVSRRVGNAVVRNRIKRGIREWFRRNRDALDGPADYVVIARRRAAMLSPGGIGDALNEMVFGSGRARGA